MDWDSSLEETGNWDVISWYSRSCLAVCVTGIWLQLSWKYKHVLFSFPSFCSFLKPERCFSSRKQVKDDFLLSKTWRTLKVLKKMKQCDVRKLKVLCRTGLGLIRKDRICVCVCVWYCVCGFMWFMRTQICIMTWVWQRYYNLKVFMRTLPMSP